MKKALSTFSQMKSLSLKTGLLPKSVTPLLHLTKRNYIQTNHLQEVTFTAYLEEKQRTAKMVEYTDKVYKPSKTITFDRNGELLLFSCDNVKNSQLYLKYPYVMYDMTIPLAMYNFFVDPCKFYCNF